MFIIKIYLMIYLIDVYPYLEYHMTRKNTLED
jgi:hypothetical protein